MSLMRRSWSAVISGTLSLFVLNSYGAAKENLLSCAMLDGSLSHKLSQRSDGSYEFLASFPFYYKMPSIDVIKQTKEEWASWDGLGDPPRDPRQLAIAFPLTQLNVFSFDLERLGRLRENMHDLFPPQPIDEKLDSSTGQLLLHFPKANCQISKNGELFAALCQSAGLQIINGVEVSRVSLRMATQKKQELIISEDGFETQEAFEVSATLFYQYKGRELRSSMTYRPNGNDRQCWLGVSPLM